MVGWGAHDGDGCRARWSHGTQRRGVRVGWRESACEVKTTRRRQAAADSLRVASSSVRPESSSPVLVTYSYDLSGCQGGTCERETLGRRLPGGRQWVASPARLGLVHRLSRSLSLPSLHALLCLSLYPVHSPRKERTDPRTPPSCNRRCGPPLPPHDPWPPPSTLCTSPESLVEVTLIAHSTLRRRATTQSHVDRRALGDAHAHRHFN